MKINVFKTTHCGPCKMMHGIIQQLIQNDKISNLEIKYYDMETEEGQSKAELYGVYSVPSLVCNHNHGEYEIIVGFTPLPVLEQKLLELERKSE